MRYWKKKKFMVPFTLLALIAITGTATATTKSVELVQTVGNSNQDALVVVDDALLEEGFYQYAVDPENYGDYLSNHPRNLRAVTEYDRSLSSDPIPENPAEVLLNINVGTHIHSGTMLPDGFNEGDRVIIVSSDNHDLPFGGVHTLTRVVSGGGFEIHIADFLSDVPSSSTPTTIRHARFREIREGNHLMQATVQVSAGDSIVVANVNTPVQPGTHIAVYNASDADLIGIHQVAFNHENGIIFSITGYSPKETREECFLFRYARDEEISDGHILIHARFNVNVDTRSHSMWYILYGNIFEASYLEVVSTDDTRITGVYITGVRPYLVNIDGDVFTGGTFLTGGSVTSLPPASSVPTVFRYLGPHEGTDTPWRALPSSTATRTPSPSPLPPSVTPSPSVSNIPLPPGF